MDGISIMLIDEVDLEPCDVITLPSKRLQRYWNQVLSTVYLYGLNDKLKVLEICLAGSLEYSSL